MAEKASNTIFVTKEEQELADEANLKSLRVRASVQEIAEDSLNKNGSLNKKQFAENLNKKYKNVTQGEVFEKLIKLIATKYKS